LPTDKKSPDKPDFKFSSINPQVNPAYNSIALTGQAETQAPQSMQVSSLQTALSSFIESAATGHVSTQALQPIHVSLSIFTAIYSSCIYLMRS
jgi:hypothetical protein